MKKFKTILIEITDDNAYKKFNDIIFDSMIEEKPNEYGFKMIAFSNEDEFARVEQFEQDEAERHLYGPNL